MRGWAPATPPVDSAPLPVGLRDAASRARGTRPSISNSRFVSVHEFATVKSPKNMNTETKPAYSPGLAGVIAGETEICWVDPNAGLMYRGYDIHDMAEKASFEEVAYLLLNGELPDLELLAKFSRQIASEREVPAPVMKMLRLLPRDIHPMDMVRTGVSMLGAFDPELNDNSHEANVRKADPVDCP